MMVQYIIIILTLTLLNTNKLLRNILPRLRIIVTSKKSILQK